MKKQLFLTTTILILLTVIFSTLYITTKNQTALTIAVSIGTTAYHFVMRLFIGLCLGKWLKLKKENWWFKEKRFEKKLYKFLKVKKWKNKLPTYNPDTFDIKKKSFSDIVSATCYSELGHEVMAALSFLPLLLVFPFGEITVFAITSTLGAIFDLLFAIIQRYNRPRLLKCLHG